jgi:hypothetical protein
METMEMMEVMDENQGNTFDGCDTIELLITRQLIIGYHSMLELMKETQMKA